MTRTFFPLAILAFCLCGYLMSSEPSPTPTRTIGPKKTSIPLSIFRKPTPEPRQPQAGSFGFREAPLLTGQGWSTPSDFADFMQEACGGKRKPPSEDEKILGAVGKAAGIGMAGVAAVQWLDAQGKDGKRNDKKK